MKLVDHLQFFKCILFIGKLLFCSKTSFGLLEKYWNVWNKFTIIFAFFETSKFL